MLLLLLLRTLAGLLRLTRPAAPAAPSPPVARLRLAPRRALRHLLLRRTLLLSLRTVRARAALLLLLLLFSALLLLRLSRPLAVSLALAVARLLLLRPLVLPRCFSARALLEVAQLLVHVPRRLPLVLEAQLVMAAVRAALPSLGIGLLAGGAKDAFRERHREIGAHCTLRPPEESIEESIEESVDESRRRTLLTLIHLAEENSPSACWDDRRAMELLRREATAAELRELGMDEQLIAHVFAEEHAR
ncbi:MAG TPA: hypothetical protein VFP80_09800 [Thermoanaerobaculia bacterium]|nr:hypothetical protein [Thermoanaerobaculia bacterium]